MPVIIMNKHPQGFLTHNQLLELQQKAHGFNIPQNSNSINSLGMQAINPVLVITSK